MRLGNSVAIGTNFLAKGHLDVILKQFVEDNKLLNEGLLCDEEMFPGLADMMAVFLYVTLRKKLSFNLIDDVLAINSVIMDKYNEDNVKSVSIENCVN